jgi:hypothetical protein
MAIRAIRLRASVAILVVLVLESALEAVYAIGLRDESGNVRQDGLYEHDDYRLQAW